MISQVCEQMFIINYWNNVRNWGELELSANAGQLHLHLHLKRQRTDNAERENQSELAVERQLAHVVANSQRAHRVHQRSHYPQHQNRIDQRQRKYYCHLCHLNVCPALNHNQTINVVLLAIIQRTVLCLFECSKGDTNVYLNILYIVGDISSYRNDFKYILYTEFFSSQIN